MHPIPVPILQQQDGATASCVNGADTAWVLLSFVLVLAMFAGLALFEGGLLPVSATMPVCS